MFGRRETRSHGKGYFDLETDMIEASIVEEYTGISTLGIATPELNPFQPANSRLE